MDREMEFKGHDRGNSFWGLHFGMDPSDVFRSGAGIDERNECGSVTLADIYPRSELRDSAFTHYEGLFDASYGLFGISARSERGDIFEMKLDETASFFGPPQLVRRNLNEDGVKVALWKNRGSVVMLEERADEYGNVVTEINHSALVFPEIWEGRNERKKA